MTKEEKGMRPIWYFVGWILFLIGALVVMSGIYSLFYPVPSKTVLQELHPNLWWGGLMVVFGLIFIFKNKGVTVD